MQVFLHYDIAPTGEFCIFLKSVVETDMRDGNIQRWGRGRRSPSEGRLW
jgi:hypothetical protein